MSIGLRIQNRRDTAANWASADPVLLDGELGYDSTNRIARFGDGSTAWSSLSALGATVSDGDKGDIAVSSGGAAWTIDAGAVSLAKMANLAANSLIGNDTGSPATPSALSASDVKSLLGLVPGSDVQAYDAQLASLAALALSGHALEVLRVDGGETGFELATLAIEGSAVLSSGEAGGSKYLHEDGDGTCSWQAIPGGGDALTSSPLSQFAATTSAQLAGVISDESGTGALLFGTGPTIATPTLTLKQSAGPTPTAEGDIQWDSDDDRIVVGDGSGQKVFSSDADLSITESQISDLGSYITAAGVTYENLDANGDVGTGSSQVAAGNHAHAAYLAIADIDDVPVDSETSAPISSNWARDHENSTAAHGAAGAVVGTTDTQSLTNKTLTTPVLSATAGGATAGRLGYGSGDLTFGDGSSQQTVATLSGSQTLANKTLASPVLTSPDLGTPGSGALANCAGYRKSIVIAVSDETGGLTAGAAKVTFRMPYDFTLVAVRASVTTAPTGSALTIDINKGGASILSTKLTIDAAEKTSSTAASAAVIADSALTDDAEITIDIDSVGNTFAGAGLKVALIGSIRLNPFAFPAPVLALDFTASESLDSRVTASGGGNRNRFDSGGALVSASCPRFDHAIGTGAALGLLVERGTTNGLEASEDLSNATWCADHSSGTTTITTDATAAPDGNTTADRMDSSASDTPQYGWLDFPGSGTHQFSVFIKGTGSDTYYLYLGGNPLGQCDLTTSWQRFSGEYAVSGFSTWDIRQPNSRTCYAWGGMLEENADCPTSYVASGVSATADVLTMTGTDFSDWWDGSAGTFRVIADSPGVGTKIVLQADDGTADNRITIWTDGTTAKATIVTGGATQADLSLGSVTPGVEFTVALAFAEDDVAASLDGAAQVADASVSLPTVDRCRLGADTGGNQLCGHLKSVRFYDQRISDVEALAS